MLNVVDDFVEAEIGDRQTEGQNPRPERRRGFDIRVGIKIDVSSGVLFLPLVHKRKSPASRFCGPTGLEFFDTLNVLRVAHRVCWPDWPEGDPTSRAARIGLKVCTPFTLQNLRPRARRSQLGVWRSLRDAQEPV